jgi:hypothetical protein
VEKRVWKQIKLMPMTDEYIKSLEQLIEFLDRKISIANHGNFFIDSSLSLEKPLLKTLNKLIPNKNDTRDVDSQNIHNHSEEPFIVKSLLIKQKQNSIKNKIIDMSSNKWNWNILTGKVIFSVEWCNSLGYEVDELRPHVKTWENMVHPDDLSQTFSQLNAHLKGNTPVYVVRNRLKMKNGKWRSNIDAGRVIQRDEKNNPISMEGVDIFIK